jgi:DNA-binding MarR family transcriptional regulator
MGAARKGKHQLAEEIVGRLARQHSTAVVLFHHAVAERLGLGPTDHKCMDLLRDRGAMAGSDLGAITGLTSGAITGVVARLERAGYLRREPDPHDGRKQILHLARQRVHIQDVIDPLREDVAALLENFDTHQVTAIAEFLARTMDLVYRHAALLRAETISAMGRTRVTGQATSPAREKVSRT